MAFSSQPPSDMRFQIQKRVLPDGDSSDWAIFKIYYPLPNVIEVLANGQVVKPNP